MKQGTFWRKFGRLLIDLTFFAIGAFVVIFASLYLTKESSLKNLVDNGELTASNFNKVIAERDTIIAWVGIVFAAVGVISTILSVFFFWRKAQWGWTTFNLVVTVIALGLGIYITYRFAKIQGYTTAADIVGAVFNT